MTLREFFPHRLRVPSPGSRIPFVLITLLVCASAGDVFAEKPATPNYTMAVWASEKGLPPGDVFAIAQDLEGYLWVGGPTGLLRFDGNRFSPWQPADPASGLPSGPVHAIVGSHDGSIWVGLGGGGGVVRIQRGQIVKYSTAEGAPPGVSAMTQDRQGAIWVATRRGLFKFANNRWTLVGKSEGYNGSEAFSLYEDRAGHLWVGTASGIYKKTKDVFELVDAAATNIQSMTEDASGNIWVTDAQEVLMRLSTHSTPQHERTIASQQVRGG